MTSPPFPATSPLALQAVIARIESTGNPRAIRFEPRVNAAGVPAPIADRIAALHGCDAATAVAIAATSWGLYQIMGMNLWSGPHPYDGTLFAYCADPIEQHHSFEMFLCDRGLDWTLAELLADSHKLDAFAAAYNGDAATYAPSMRAAAAALRYAT